MRYEAVLIEGEAVYAGRGTTARAAIAAACRKFQRKSEGVKLTESIDELMADLALADPGVTAPVNPNWGCVPKKINKLQVIWDNNRSVWAGGVVYPLK